jgi:hypothetical protein
MTTKFATNSAYPADGRRLREEGLPSEGSAGEAALRLTKRASLMVALLLSLGLWAAIWAAVAALASAILG